jgi:hypothetical protein
MALSALCEFPLQDELRVVNRSPKIHHESDPIGVVSESLLEFVLHW